MVAVVDDGVIPPEQRRSRRPLRRLVAVAISPEEVRPGSPLLARLAGVEHVDLLLITDGDEARALVDFGADSDPDIDADDEGDGPDPADGVRAVAAAVGLRVAVHRLGLARPSAARPADEDDVVAAISELVGFDPEPGVGCVVPGPPHANGPADQVVGRAVERIVAAYGLPLLTYVPLAN